MTPRIGVQLLFGAEPEPFLGAALHSVRWADYFCIVNTAPNDMRSYNNEAWVRRVVPRSKLRYDKQAFGATSFSFAEARNTALAMANEGDYVLRLDADEVHYPELEKLAREWARNGWPLVEGHFYHLIGYKDLLGELHGREFFLKKVPGLTFTGAVHEQAVIPSGTERHATGYRWVHYGYIKPQREIFRRWKHYAQLEGEPDRYQGRNPDDIIDEWFPNCTLFWQGHPPAAQAPLKGYSEGAAKVWPKRDTDSPRCGLVLLTWDDAENLELCLSTLERTTEPFKLVVVDNGSRDGSQEMVFDWQTRHPEVTRLLTVGSTEGLSLTAALNIGFSRVLEEEDLDYVGWIHPDMVFETPAWLHELRSCLDTHPEYVKVGAKDLNEHFNDEPVAGNTQCYLVRRTALEQAGLFNEEFLACGGYEDWEHNYRLLKLGRVMIWPEAKVRHFSMSTRSRHNNLDAANHNADVYHRLTGTRDPAV